MYLKKSKMNNGRVYLSIAEGKRDPQTKRIHTVNVQKIGYLDALQNEYPDPIAHFSKVVEEMNSKKEQGNKHITIAIDENIKIVGNQRKNFGYMALSAVYHELEIDKFFAYRQKYIDTDYNMNSIMRLLVFARLLSPGSKKKAYEERDWFFERNDFSLVDIYRALSRYNALSEALQLWIHERIVAKYGRDTSITYYDVTNYYFEIDEQDALRRKGVFKEHRPDPIVQMGLFMDNSGLPVAYQLFPGNSNDCTTLLPIVKRIRRQYGIGKAVVVSDKDLNTGKNAYYLANSRGGYVFSQSVRGGTAELKAYVLKESGYQWLNESFKKKSRQFTREVDFEDDNGRRIRAKIAEKQVVFYSKDYAAKAKADRANAIKKAHSIISSPKNFNKHNTYGAAKYIRHIEFDKETGEILEPKSILTFNDELLAEEEKYDGYYVIVTSRHHEKDNWIIETYKGLWRIEETFRVSKSELEARPVYVSREDRINAHFLTCFVAMVIIRLLQFKLDFTISAGKILDSLAKACCSNIQDNVYMYDYYDDVLAKIGSCFGIDFAQKFRTQANIKNISANVKIR